MRIPLISVRHNVALKPACSATKISFIHLILGGVPWLSAGDKKNTRPLVIMIEI